MSDAIAVGRWAATTRAPLHTAANRPSRGRRRVIRKHCDGARGLSAERVPLFMEDEIGIDRLPLPPPFVVAEHVHGEMQVWRSGWRVSTGADITDHIAGGHVLAGVQPLGVPLEMCVVV